MNPKVSLIVPVYNVEQYIEKCVESITLQTYQNIEIILVDDGSKDNSGRICDQLKESDDRIVVIHQDNEGLPAARNSGLRISSGNYIMFIDSDDWIDRNMVELMLNRLMKTGSDIVVCNAQTFNKTGMNHSPLGRYSDDVIDYSNGNCLEFYYSALDACWNHLFTASLIKDNGIYFDSKEVVAQEDFYFQIKAYSYANRIATISDKLYKYRERGSSISKKGQSSDFPEKCLKFVHYTEDYIMKHTDRKCANFIEYQFLNMLMASINNVPENTIESIIKTIELFKRDELFKSSLRRDVAFHLYPNNSLQHRYYRTIVMLIRCNCIKLASSLEKKRIAKLRSNSRTDVYFA